jgi:uncharacterized protein (DUF488 family)
MSRNPIFTIGHSTHSFEAFVALLELSEVTAIVDVRSSPWSRHNPQFNRSALKESLRLVGIDYRFYGKQLGGRPTNSSLFSGSTADYEAMARTPEFADGLKMVFAGAAKHRLALMCSEHNPLDCHRCLLVGRALKEFGTAVFHVLSNGQTISQEQIEQKLLEISGREAEDFFVPQDERLDAAYRDRSLKVAYSEREAISLLDDDFVDVRYG